MTKRRYDWTEDQIYQLIERVKVLEAKLAKVAPVLRGIDEERPEWGLRTLVEELEK